MIIGAALCHSARAMVTVRAIAGEDGTYCLKVGSPDNDIPSASDLDTSLLFDHDTPLPAELALQNALT